VQNDFKIEIINTKLFKIKIKNHSNDLKSRFKVILFEIIPNTAYYQQLRASHHMTSANPKTQLADR